MNASLDVVAASYSSKEAAEISGVPFFTVDYWDRTRFLQPTLAKSGGRGRGRERQYSFTDMLRLRVARDLRDQHVSLQTLRHVVSMLAMHAGDLHRARYVLVDREVRLLASVAELTALLRGGTIPFGFFLDLSQMVQEVTRRAEAVTGRATAPEANIRSIPPISAVAPSPAPRRKKVRAKP